MVFKQRRPIWTALRSRTTKTGHNTRSPSQESNSVSTEFIHCFPSIRHNRSRKCYRHLTAQILSTEFTFVKTSFTRNVASCLSLRPFPSNNGYLGIYKISNRAQPTRDGTPTLVLCRHVTTLHRKKDTGIGASLSKRGAWFRFLWRAPKTYCAEQKKGLTFWCINLRMKN
jgi:hypothetical protein